MTEIHTRAEAEQATKRGARVAALKSGAEAARDTAVLRAQNTNSDRIKRLSEEDVEIRAALKTWAEANRQEFTGQSLVFAHGTLNFRKGNPEVSFLEGWNLKKVITAMVRGGQVLSRWRAWVRIKFELHRQNILSDCSKNPEPVQKKLSTIGLQVIQQESFEVEFGVKQKL